MDINIYKTYNFAFDTDEYIKNFKEALYNADIKTLTKFNKLLENAGIKYYDYETVKSYFYGRRVPPIYVFITVCKYLSLNADDIAFPNSVPDFQYENDTLECEDLFRNIFYPYNPSEDGGVPDNLTELFDSSTYESDVDTLALILSKYNYLIQKYHYVSVSNDERTQISYFTERYIVDRNKDVIIDAEEVLKWIRDYNDENFLEAFYNKYTLGFYTKKCHSLLEILRTAIDFKFIRCAEQLLPDQDKYRGEL